MPPAPPTRRLILAAPVLFAPMLRPSRAQAQGRTQEAVLRVVAPWTYDTPDPADTGFILTRIGIGEMLVTVGPDGKLVGEVAESWAVDPDRLTWRFRLRDARFHDGTPVTAAVVAAGLQRLQPKAETLSTLPLVAIEPNGTRELVLRTRTPFAPLPAFLVDYAGVVLAPSSFNAAGEVVRPVATGPYRVTAISGTQTIEAEAFPDHWGIRPAIPGSATPPPPWARPAPTWRRLAKRTSSSPCCPSRRSASRPEAAPPSCGRPSPVCACSP